MAGPQDTEDLAARRRQVGGQVQGVDGDDRVGEGSTARLAHHRL
jgi:hypothetical protein